MAAPTNISALTATDLGTFPASVSQNVHDAGTTYTVWYSFVASSTYVVSIFGFGDLSTYTPTMSIFTGPASSPVAYLSLSGQNKPLMFPVEAGETYYIKCETNGGDPTPATLLLRGEIGPEKFASVGDIFINTFATATDAFPAVILSSVDGDNDNVKRFQLDIANGETGDLIPTLGLMLLADELNNDLKIYDANDDYALVASVAFASTVGFRQIRALVGGEKWYVGRAGDGVVRTVLPDGSFGGTTWTLTATQITGGLAASPDEAILYHCSPSTGQPIKRYDLVNSTPLSDLAAGVTNYSTFDIVVLEDATILVTYRKSTVTTDGFVRHYATDGSTIIDYPLGQVASHPRLAMAEDSPDSFWIWNLPSSPAGLAQFFNVETATGSILRTVTYETYERGIYDMAANADPELFGPDNSCPFMILRTGTEPPIPPDFEIVEDPIRWLRRSPIQASENRRVFWELFSLEIDPGVGLASGDDQDVDPQVMMRFSVDNGKTWSTEMWRSMGRVGKWQTRLQWWNLGTARNLVIEVSGSAAVHTVLIDGYAQASPSVDSPTS